MSVEHERLKQILAEAAGKPSAERAAYLDAACQGDADLRQQVETLLAVHEHAGDFLEKTVEIPPSEFVVERTGTMIGRYKLLERIGEGGFGVVFMAEQTEPVNRKVALKIIKAGMDTREVIARFEAERQALALMDHPNIAKILDAGVTGDSESKIENRKSKIHLGRPYFVMELVRGMPITGYCDQKNLPTAERLQLFMLVCHAVQHAHQKGIIHRDLKPTNILVTEIDGKPVPKVIDFGVAKALGQRLTEKTLFTAFHQMVGTPAYMSPEQAELSGVDVDTRSDIYSLGVLLYELLTGVTPFDAETLRKAALDEIRRMIRETEPPKPSTRLRQQLVSADARRLHSKSAIGNRQSAIEGSHRLLQIKETIRLVHGDLDWIVMKALEKDRSRRYETAGSLVEDLQRHLDHQPVQASPPGTVYRARKFIRRHRVGVALSATAVGALVVGLSVAVVGFVQAQQARNRAVSAEHQTAQERDRAVTAEQRTEQERNHAELLAAEAALAEGQAKLEAGDNWGLLDMVKAFDLAKHHPAFQEAVGRRWSTWQAYWDRLTLAVRTSRGTLSPDHLQNASVWGWPPLNIDRTVHIYDTLSGAPIVGPLVHDSVALGCAFSPDGRLFATLTKEGVIHIWDRNSGAPVRRPCPTGVSGLECISFSPCSRYLVAFARASNAGPSRIAFLRLDRSDGYAHILDHRYPVNEARFSPDSMALAVLCKPDLQLWRSSDCLPMDPRLTVNMNGLLEFSADGTWLAFNPEGLGGIGLLDTGTRQVIRRISKDGTDPARAAFSHDRRLLACFNLDNSIEIWDTESATLRYPGQKVCGKLCSSLMFNRDDSLLAVGEANGTIRVFRTSDGQSTYTLHVPLYPQPVFLTNGVLAAGASGKVHFWDLAETPLPALPLPNDALAYTLQFDHTGKFLAVGGEGELRLWAMQPLPKLERIYTLPGRVMAVSFSDADGQFVAFSDDGSVTVVESSTGNTMTRSNCERGYEMSASISPDGRKLALFRYTELVFANTRTGVCQPLNPEGGVRSIAFRGDSTAMAVGFASWNITPYDTTSETNTPAGAPWKFDGWVEGVAYHPGGKLVAVCIGGSTLHLFEAEKKLDVGSIRKPSVRVDFLRFSGDGALLAVAGAAPDSGQAVELWHVDPQRGLFFSGVSLPCDQPIWSVAFSPDNRTLVVGGLGATRLWHLPSPPKDLREIESKTWATLGFRLDEQGQRIYLEPPRDGAEEIRARLTQERVRFDSPLDAALNLPTTDAQAALEKLVAQYPDSKAYQTLLSRAHAAQVTSKADQGLWAEALAHADEALRLGHDDPHTRYQRSLVCLGAGDAAGYRATCRAMVERYKPCNDPAVIKWVGWSAALVPGALDDYTDLIAKLGLAARRISGWHGPAYRFWLGAVLARAGRYQEAVAELEQVNQHLKAEGAFVDFSPIYLEFLLAVCHAHLGNEGAARQWYETGCADARKLLDQGPQATSWNRRLTIELLRKEAESLVNTHASQPTKSPDE
jgi:serine/threonine protein kinase/WD40 repeat protein